MSEEVEEKIAVIDTWIECPRWAKLPSFLRKLALIHDVEIMKLEKETGWIRETVFFRVEGSLEQMTAFRNDLERAVREYNK
jgi:hypothetical protein